MLSPPGMAHTAIATTSCVALNCVGTHRVAIHNSIFVFNVSHQETSKGSAGKCGGDTRSAIAVIKKHGHEDATGGRDLLT